MLLDMAEFVVSRCHTPDLFFQPLFAFFITEHSSRRIVHIGVTRSPTDAWVAQQLREATPFGVAPTYLIRDNDAKYSSHFDAVAVGTGIEVLRTPVQAPRANAICERLLGSVRRECLDHIVILRETHLRRVLTEYWIYFNRARPHQGIGQQVPAPLRVRAGAALRGAVDTRRRARWLCGAVSTAAGALYLLWTAPRHGRERATSEARADLCDVLAQRARTARRPPVAAHSARRRRHAGTGEGGWTRARPRGLSEQRRAYRLTD